MTTRGKGWHNDSAKHALVNKGIYINERSGLWETNHEPLLLHPTIDFAIHNTSNGKKLLEAYNGDENAIESDLDHIMPGMHTSEPEITNYALYINKTPVGKRRMNAMLSFATTVMGKLVSHSATNPAQAVEISRQRSFYNSLKKKLEMTA
jgi:hypothetical protein